MKKHWKVFLTTWSLLFIALIIYSFEVIPKIMILPIAVGGLAGFWYSLKCYFTKNK